MSLRPVVGWAVACVVLDVAGCASFSTGSAPSKTGSAPSPPAIAPAAQAASAISGRDRAYTRAVCILLEVIIIAKTPAEGGGGAATAVWNKVALMPVPAAERSFAHSAGAFARAYVNGSQTGMENQTTALMPACQAVSEPLT